MDGLFVVIAVWLVFAAAFGAFGWWVASQKGREPMIGGAIGFLFGPVGVLVLAMLPAVDHERLSRSEGVADETPAWLSQAEGERKPGNPEEAWLRELENRHRPKK